MDLSVRLIDEVYHHFYHYVFLFRLALCNHQREGNERIVSNAFDRALHHQMSDRFVQWNS